MLDQSSDVAVNCVLGNPEDIRHREAVQGECFNAVHSLEDRTRCDQFGEGGRMTWTETAPMTLPGTISPLDILKAIFNLCLSVYADGDGMF